MRFRRRLTQLWKLEFWQPLLFSAPTILACVFWIAFAILFFRWTPDRIQDEYAGAAARAMAERSYEKARVAYERLVQLDQRSDPAHIFGLASSLRGLGREQEANALLSSLASLDSAGYAPAHVLVAQSILLAPSVDAASLQAAETHLKRALAAEPNNIDVRMLLGELYLRTGQWEQAKEQLLKAFPARKEAMLGMASAAAAEGNETESRRWAEQAQRNYKVEVKSNPNETLPRLRLAEATQMLGDFAEAVNVLKAGIAQTGNRVYSEMASRVYAGWAGEVAKESPRDLGQRLSLIQRGLECAPNHEQLLVQLVALSSQSGKEAEAARAEVSKLLTAGGEDTAILHFFLGGDAWQRGLQEEAREHFKLAFDLTPQLPYAANNVALLMAQGDKPDLPRSLGMIQSVLDKFPTNPRFRDTRGQILVKMGRWEEAVKDLEFALPSLPSKTMTRTALAEAYRHLGLNDLAAEQERMAEAERTPSQSTVAPAPKAN